MIFKLRGDALIPEKGREQEARMIADSIPGLTVNETFGLTWKGCHHAVAAALAASGEKVNWSPPQHEVSPFNLPPFQRWGAGLIRQRMVRGVMCNDEIGLGKTVQTVAALSQVDPLLVKIVTCPATIRTQWKMEIERWSPVFGRKGPRVHVLYPKSDKRSKVAPQVEPGDWVVCFYLDLHRAMTLRRPHKYALVIDEIHNVAGFSTQRAEFVETCATFAGGRIGLTANKLYNKADRLYRMLSLVTPGEWGSFGSWTARYAHGGPDEGGYGWNVGELDHVEELRNRMGFMSFRRTKVDVFDQLPFEAKFQTVWLDPPGRNAALLATLASTGQVSDSYLSAMDGVKSAAVVDQIKSDVESGLPSLNFSYLRSTATAIKEQYPAALLVMGGQSSSLRLQQISAYVAKCKAAGIVPVLVSTIDALREGANLQDFKAVNFASLSYTPDDVLQAMGRSVRMGQEGSIPIRFFMCKGTIDERYQEILLTKLREQQKLEGRREVDKGGFEDALSPSRVKDLAKSILEKYRAMEGKDG